MPALCLTARRCAAPLPAPLGAALRAAETHDAARRISRAQLAQQEAQVRQALAGLTPTLEVQGQYVHNQYQGVLTYPNIDPQTGVPLGLTTITTQPYDQLQGTVGLNVPLVAPGAMARYAESKHASAGSRASDAASALEVQLAVARAYYQVVAAQGSPAAAAGAGATAQRARAVARARAAAGTANQRATDRAAVDLARAAQTRSESVRTLGVARRSLQTLSGLAVADLPTVGEQLAPAEPEDDLVRQALAQRPEVLQAREALAQAEATRTEAWTTLAPTLTGQAQEHLQNYTGFIGREGYWTLGVNLAWTLDPVGAPAQLARADASVAEQQARVDQALDTVRDDVHAAWLDVAANRARADASASEAQSATEALGLTQDQFRIGTASSLDLSQAERDAFTAEANATQARSDLAVSLLALEKATGRLLLEPAAP